MNDAEEMKHRIELLKMARELLNEEYINRRAEDHNRWLAECDVAWKTRGVKLPYPPFAPYPSEAEIVAKASSLFNFVKPSDAETASDAAIPAADIFLSKKEIDTVSKIKFGPAPQVPQETPWEKYLTPKPETAEPVLAAPNPVVESPTMTTPWAQILTPDIEKIITKDIPSTIPEVVGPPSMEVDAVSQSTSTTTIIGSMNVTESNIFQPTSGIKNLLPSWLQRNQSNTKGTP